LLGSTCAALCGREYAAAWSAFSTPLYARSQLWRSKPGFVGLCGCLAFRYRRSEVLGSFGHRPRQTQVGQQQIGRQHLDLRSRTHIILDTRTAHSKANNRTPSQLLDRLHTHAPVFRARISQEGPHCCCTIVRELHGHLMAAAIERLELAVRQHQVLIPLQKLPRKPLSNAHQNETMNACSISEQAMEPYRHHTIAIIITCRA
jgi:hypothetical protein